MWCLVRCCGFTCIFICELAVAPNIMPAIAMTRLVAMTRKCFMSSLLGWSFRSLFESEIVYR
jgi:hypothetical protein